jgi:hypothetical protein
MGSLESTTAHVYRDVHSGAHGVRRAWARVGAVAGAALLACVLLAAPASAQTEAAAAAGDPPAARAPLYSPEQLDQMLAPLALYPDDLLGQILMAATYPLEVVQADRWLQDPANASLRGSALAQALQSLPWDASVKSLVAYPQILAWMDSGLDWTEAVGDAFLAQQADVMDSVQRLRGRARAAGTLSSSPQQTVTTDDQAIQITSPGSSVEYVPVYDPEVAYGPWPYPDYPPYDFVMPGYAVGTFIAYPILVSYWGWDRCDWRHHRIDVDNSVGAPSAVRPMRPAPLPRPAVTRPVAWRHDPAHRGGVPYRDPVSRAKFEGTADLHSVRSNYRGYYPARPEPAPLKRPAQQSLAAPSPTARPQVAERPMPSIQRSMPAPMPTPEVRRPVPAMPRPEARAAPAPVERAMPPAMESFGHGPEVHVQEQRGSASRESAPGGSARGGHR